MFGLIYFTIAAIISVSLTIFFYWSENKKGNLDDSLIGMIPVVCAVIGLVWPLVLFVGAYIGLCSVMVYITKKFYKK